MIHAYAHNNTPKKTQIVSFTVINNRLRKPNQTTKPQLNNLNGLIQVQDFFNGSVQF